MCKSQHFFFHLTNGVLLCIRQWDCNHERDTVPPSWSLCCNRSLNYTNLTLFNILRWLPIPGLKSSLWSGPTCLAFISPNSLCCSHTDSGHPGYFLSLPENPLRRSLLCHHYTLHMPMLKHLSHHTGIITLCAAKLSAFEDLRSLTLYIKGVYRAVNKCMNYSRLIGTKKDYINSVGERLLSSSGRSSLRQSWPDRCTFSRLPISPWTTQLSSNLLYWNFTLKGRLHKDISIFFNTVSFKFKLAFCYPKPNS